MDETCGRPDDNTYFGAQRCLQITLGLELEPSQSHWVCGAHCDQTVRAQMCLVSGCPAYTRHRFSGIPSRKPRSPPFTRWCGIPWAPTRLPLWVLPLRCWRWRRCRRVSPWLSAVPPSSFPIDIVVVVFSSFEMLIFSLTLLIFWTYRSQRLLRVRQASVLQFKALF